MAVTATTITANGVTYNVYQFSGVVTDDQLTTSNASGTQTGAWGTLRDANSGAFFIDRAIYIDSTADLRQLRGNYSIVARYTTTVNGVAGQNLGFILHSGRNATNTVLQNFTITQPIGGVVSNRGWFITGWNGQAGSGITELGRGSSTDGLGLRNSTFLWAANGQNTGQSDNRFLSEPGFGILENALIGAQRYTTAVTQPGIGFSNVLRGVTFNKAAGFPQCERIGSTPGTNDPQINHVIYRSTIDNGVGFWIRPFYNCNQAFVDSYFTLNDGDTGTTAIGDFYPTTSPARAYGKNVMAFNNWQLPNWFGTTKTTIPVNNYRYVSDSVRDVITGGVLKKLQFVDSATGGALEDATIKCYDSRSNTVPQTSLWRDDVTAAGFPANFLDPNTTPTTDVNGRIWIAHIGATAVATTNGTVNAAITRYTNQRYTFQLYGYNVLVGTPSMTSGDNDLSAYAPVSVPVRPYITRTQAQVNSATNIANIEQLGEEIHNIAVGLTGNVSYNADFDGNLYEIDGADVNTLFSNITVNPSAGSKIAYDSVSDTLTVMDVAALVLTSNLNAITTNGNVTLTAQPSAVGSVGITANNIALGVTGTPSMFSFVVSGTGSTTGGALEFAVRNNGVIQTGINASSPANATANNITGFPASVTFGGSTWTVTTTPNAGNSSTTVTLTETVATAYTWTTPTVLITSANPLFYNGVSGGSTSITLTAGTSTGGALNTVQTVNGSAGINGTTVLQPLTATTRITGLPTTGTLVNSAAVDFGAGIVSYVARTFPVSAAWIIAIAGNGVFVVIGQNSTIAVTSPDGITWTQRTLPVSANWFASTFGNGLFVVFGFSSSIAITSSDGINWTQRTLPISSTWNAIAYGNGIFVAITRSSTGDYATSTDGINWTARTDLLLASKSAIAFGKGIFVVIPLTSSNEATMSPDGINWTASTLPTAVIWTTVTYGRGMFVAIAGSIASNVYATSPDGITWTQRTLPVSANWRSIAYGYGIFVLFGGGTNVSLRSTDGINWVQNTLASSQTVFSVAYLNNVFVAPVNTSINLNTVNLAPSSVSVTGDLTFTNASLSGALSLNVGATPRSLTLNNCGNLTETFPFQRVGTGLISVFPLGNTTLPTALPSGFQASVNYTVLLGNTVGITDLTTVRVNKLYTNNSSSSPMALTLTTSANGITASWFGDANTRYDGVLFIDSLTPFYFTKAAGSSTATITPSGGVVIDPSLLDFTQRANFTAADTTFINSCLWSVVTGATPEINVSVSSAAYDRTSSREISKMVIRAMMERDTNQSYHFGIAQNLTTSGVSLTAGWGPSALGTSGNNAWTVRFFKATASNNVVVLNLWNTDSLGLARSISVSQVDTQVQFAGFSPGPLAQITGQDIENIAAGVEEGLIGTQANPGALSLMSRGIEKASLVIPTKIPLPPST